MSEKKQPLGWNQPKNESKMAATKRDKTPAGDTSLAPPSMYEVFLANDGQTPMDFFTLILKKFFNKTQEHATYITLDTHKRGQGLCGKFTRDVAETKITLVSDYAHKYNYDIKCVMQKESCDAIKKS